MSNLHFFMIVLTFLGGVQNRMSEQLQKDIEGNLVVLDDQTMELKKEVSGGSTIDLLDATMDRVDGINSFDKDRLQTGRAFVFDQIALGYATHATDSGLEGNIVYNTAAPKELQNAVLIIKQGGREVLRLPVRDINNIHTADTESKEYKQLKSLRYLTDKDSITVQLKFAPGVSLSGAVKHYVYLRLNGLQTAPKTAA